MGGIWVEWEGAGMDGGCCSGMGGCWCGWEVLQWYGKVLVMGGRVLVVWEGAGGMGGC